MTGGYMEFVFHFFVVPDDDKCILSEARINLFCLKSIMLFVAVLYSLFTKLFSSTALPSNYGLCYVVH
jgi:hypothetical protein